MQIFARIPRVGASKDSGVSSRTFLAFSVATSSETSAGMPALSVVCRQRPIRKLCSGREIRYESKFSPVSL